MLNGDIEVVDVVLSGNIEIVNGDICIEGYSQIDGDIIFKCLYKSNNSDIFSLVLGDDVMFDGSIILECDVNLMILDRLKFCILW